MQSAMDDLPARSMTTTSTALPSSRMASINARRRAEGILDFADAALVLLVVDFVLSGAALGFPVAALVSLGWGMEGSSTMVAVGLQRWLLSVFAPASRIRVADALFNFPRTNTQAGGVSPASSRARLASTRDAAKRFAAGQARAASE